MNSIFTPSTAFPSAADQRSRVAGQDYIQFRASVYRALETAATKRDMGSNEFQTSTWVSTKSYTRHSVVQVMTELVQGGYYVTDDVAGDRIEFSWAQKMAAA